MNEALVLAIKILKQGDHSEARLREKLSAFSPEEVDEALAHARQKKWVDDHRLAERTVEKARTAHLSRQQTETQLEKLGLPTTLLEWSDGDERKSAQGQLLKRLKPGDGIARAARVLTSRGFDEDVVRSLLEEWFARD